MNLHNTIDLLAGGPGSGCRGPNCGRPAADRPSIAKIVAIDFDDTIAKHIPTNRNIADPLPHGLELIKALKAKGYTVHVLTARHNIKWVQSWLDSHGVGFAKATNRKMGAVAFVDDRAVHWTGHQSVEKALQRIENMSKARLQMEQQERSAKQNRTTGIQAAILLYGGGPGSGCNPQVGKCGRTAGPGQGEWDEKESTKSFYLNDEGSYIPARTAIHDQLIQKYQNKTQQKNPVMTVLVGGTASGKSTYDEIESKKLRDPTVIDVDKIRADLPEFKQVAGTPGSELVLDEARDVRDQVMMSALAHNNDIALEAVGHPDTPGKIDDIEKSGYKVNVVYVHRPVDESVALANKRASDSPTLSGRIKPPESLIRANHQQTRAVLGPMIKPGREITVYDGTGDFDINKPYPVIYHRGADGKVDIKNDAALERMRNAEEPKIPDVFN